ncbi:MAG: hypothetical protein JWN43_1715 [Gammaproteobacteria bacterium]|nr:hypothetical protein [Gammaproteobacteria bacterium]
MKSSPMKLCSENLAFGLLISAAVGSRADNFQSVAYDPATDEVVVGVIYRGTNPNHRFTLQWGACETHDDQTKEIAGELLDDQAQDAARQDFSKTVRFSAAELECRPATATIRTAPRFYATVKIPPRPTAATKP